MRALGIALLLVLTSCAGGDEANVPSTQPDAPTTAAAGASFNVVPTTTPPPSTAAPTPDPPASSAAPSEAVRNGCADVVDATITATSSGFTIAATVRSADTGWEKYADAWQVRAPDGTVLGERVLAHPHETEQPFTRSLSGVAIPSAVTEVVVLARDLVAGFCGATFTIEVPHP